MIKRIAVLGSTGSIGTQSLDIISNYPQFFKPNVLTACNNAGMLIEQAKKFLPEKVVIADKRHYNFLKESLKGFPIDVYAGHEAITELMREPVADTVIGAITGYAGLKPVIAALKSGKQVALANKETLVVAGAIIDNIVKQTGNKIIPVDSEHSAIFQCLKGESHSSVEYISLTASGGPFLNLSRQELDNIKPAEALKHPKWNMGNKVTVDSASLMNKGLEVIEAKWLFDLTPEQIKVIIHPQSIIHSFVHFIDGSVKAQLGVPDMRIPILYALSYPERFLSPLPRVNFTKESPLSFFEPDTDKFRSLSLAFSALEKGGNMPCILNASNEIAVKAFLDNRIRFTQMPDVVEYSLENNTYIAVPNLEDLEETDEETRTKAEQYIQQHCI